MYENTIKNKGKRSQTVYPPEFNIIINPKRYSQKNKSQVTHQLCQNVKHDIENYFAS